MASKTSRTENKRRMVKQRGGRRRKAKQSRKSTKSAKELFGDK